MSKVSSSVPATIANTPVNVDEHNTSLESRQKKRDKIRPTHLKCLDPVVAAEYEHRKALYEWKVECKIFRPAGTKGRAKVETFCEQVVAQNENDAWAFFCDKIGEWPSRRDMQPVITRLHKRNADSED
jgi:hypothetical protein